MKDRIDLLPRLSGSHTTASATPMAAGLVLCPTLIAANPLMLMAGAWSPLYSAALEQAQRTVRLDAFRRETSFSLN